jgi:hypothetical protein
MEQDPSPSMEMFSGFSLPNEEFNNKGDCSHGPSVLLLIYNEIFSSLRCTQDPSPQELTSTFQNQH